MHESSLYQKIEEVLRKKSIHHKFVMMRRLELLKILWDERYLTSQQLIIRVTLNLGKNSFGKSVDKAAFYRDMKLLKKAFQAADIKLAYSRRKIRGGYYIIGEPPISEELSLEIKYSAAEVDIRQIEIYNKMTPAERFRQGCAISDLARRVVAYRILIENPGMNMDEANRRALRKAYSQE
jgi:hypothetical protein